MLPRLRENPLVLIIDDEINTTIMLQYIFEREGYQVERVTDGALAVRTAVDLTPDLILLDILLPHMNGFQILRHLKDDPRTEHIPTIMITANAREPGDVVEGLNLGADDYLYKPFAPQELLARIQSKLRARRLEDSLRDKTHELEFLLTASEQLNRFADRTTIAELTVSIVAQHVPADAIVLQLTRGSDNTIVRHTLMSDELLHNTLTADRIDRWLSQSPTTVRWTDNEPAPAVEVFGVSNGIAIVLEHDGQTIGVLLVLNHNSPYPAPYTRLLEGLGRHVTLALANGELFELRSAYQQQLERTIEARTQELLSANRMLVRNEKLASIGHLAASIAHEINNPLMPITLLLENLEETLRAVNSPIDFQDLTIVRENVLRIQRVVRSLLDFARQDAVARPINIGMSLSAVEKLSRHAFEMERKTIVCQTEPDLMVIGVKDQLESVFINLVLNARAALSQGGTLMISARGEGADVVVSFHDNGSGIAPEHIDRIFDPFFSTKSNGTGLGLFVTYNVINAHSGTIVVDSTQGKGTTFTLRLPKL